MCTAIALNKKDFYFGRNLDLDLSYGEGVVITPRGYAFDFKHIDSIKEHEAIIGMGIIVDGYPLYFDGVNESGVAMAGLNFPMSYHSFDYDKSKVNIASFEFIPYILSRAESLTDVKKLLENLSITNDNFSEKLPASPLHWMIADKTGSIVVESTIKGLNIYENPVGVLTNEPEFPFHMFNLNNYQNVKAKDPENNFIKNLNMPIYCKGLGGIGLPGDMSSMSRFIKAAFTKANSIEDDGEKESVNQFMHILDSVFQVKGCIHSGDNGYEITVYSSAMNTDKGIYYYKTYKNSRINSVNLHNERLDKAELIFYPLRDEEDIYAQN